MNIKKQIREVENLDLEKLVVRKYKQTFEIYPWIKSRIFHKVVMGQEVLQEKTGSVFRQQLRSLGYGFFSLFRRYDAWAFTSSSERILLDGKYIDKVMDPLTFGTNMKMLVVELQLFSRFKRKDVTSKHVVSRAIFVFAEELYSRLFLRKVQFEGKEVLAEVEAVLGTTMDVNAIVRKYLAQYRMMKFFLAILPKPKVVFLTVSYANFGYIRAWKEKGIKVVELQHGLIGAGHYGYIYHKSFDANQFPDDILVFGESDADLFKETKIPIQRTISLGRFVMDHFKQRAIPNKVPATKILVSLQDSEWSIALLKFVFASNELTNGAIEWVIQPRRTPAKVYKEQFDFPGNMVFSEHSIYEAIGKADAHLTIFSTTAVESLSIGKPTFLYDFEGAATTYLGQILASNPNVYFCSDEHEFLSAWNALGLKTLEEIADSNSNNIYSDYSGKTVKYVHELLNEVSPA